MADTLTGTFTGELASAPGVPVTGTITMNFSAAGIATELDGIKAAYDGGTLALFGGQALPASPETAITGTKLVTFTFATPAFGADQAVNGQTQTSATFTTANVMPVANGTAIFARAYKADGTTPLSDHIVAAPWQPSASIVLNEYRVIGGNLYRCTVAGQTAASGGPTGTGSAITDGGVTWAYVGPSNVSVIIFGSTQVAVGVPATMTSLVLATGPPLPETLAIATPPATVTGAAITLSGTYTSGPPQALEYSIDGTTWAALTAATIAGGNWSGTGPTFTAANPTQTVSVRDRDQHGVSTQSDPFVVTLAAPVETLTIDPVTGAVAGSAIVLTGHWTVVQPAAFEWSINAGAQWFGATAASTIIRADGTWQTSTATYANARTGVSIMIRDRLHPSVTATTAPFDVTAAPPKPETLTISTPANVVIGIPVPISGTYTNGPPPALDFSTDGTTWLPLGDPVVIGANGWSGTGPTFTATNPSQTIQIRDHATTTIKAVSASFPVNPAPVETLTIITPVQAFVGTPLGLQGAYANGPPAALEYSIDGVAFTAMTSVTIGGGLWNGTGPTYSAPASAAQVTVRDRDKTGVKAATGAFPVFQPSGAAAMVDDTGTQMTDTETPTPDVMVGP